MTPELQAKIDALAGDVAAAVAAHEVDVMEALLSVFIGLRKAGVVPQGAGDGTFGALAGVMLLTGAGGGLFGSDPMQQTILDSQNRNRIGP